ncbi:MAG TPA: replication-relaxation family protein [Hyphomicrobiaceae bacterium]|nr:replication-relaxation family protein [Hyphomicrobiaceae bacterium]
MTGCQLRYNQTMQSAQATSARQKAWTLPRLRPPQNVRNFRITERDVSLLYALAMFRFATAEQLAKFVAGSVRGVRHRLFLMAGSGLLQWPPEQANQILALAHKGSPPRVYALARKGADLLKDQGHDLAHKIDHTFRSGAVSPMTHILETTRFMVDLHNVVRACDGLYIDDHYDLLPTFPEATQKARKPFSLPLVRRTSDRDHAEHKQLFRTFARDVTLDYNTNVKTLRLVTVPDRLFRIGYGNEVLNFPYEHDCGTETHDPKKPTKKATIRRKITGYYHSFLLGQIADVWGMKRLRPLFNTMIIFLPKGIVGSIYDWWQSRDRNQNMETSSATVAKTKTD